MLQTDLVSAPYSGNHCIFLSGPAGSGKTTLAVQRLCFLLDQDIPPEQILVLVPQRTLATPYYDALHSPEAPAGSTVDVATLGGLARRALEIFWPLVAESAEFQRPDRRPHFLTLETAQYHMDHIVETFLANGAFDGITISRARLVSQIIDNLNKAAAIGFPVEEIASRLKGAWEGDSARLRIYDQVQAVALGFRRVCLEQNLLDWSLQLEVFQHQLLPLPQFRRYLLSGYRHLIVDNSEEDIPATHDLLKLWLPLCESALVVYDTDGGYRIFLGADPKGGLALANLCDQRVVLAESHVTTPTVAALGAELASHFGKESSRAAEIAHQALVHPSDPIRFHPQMLDWVADEISRLVHEEGMKAGEIAVLAPFLSDALRFSLSDRLLRHDIPVRTHRPSRELRKDGAIRCLLTLTKLAHPEWHHPPPPIDVAHALLQSIEGLDPVRAQLLTSIVYRVQDGQPALMPFYEIIPETQERIGYLFGTRYGELQDWLVQYGARRHRPEEADDDGQPESLDHFLSRLFGEVLSQKGFGFHRDFDAGAMAANLIESVQKFRQALPPPADRGEGPGVRADADPEYLNMVEHGVVAAQYISSWQVRPEDAVLLVPAYTFLMMNQPATVQFWLDAGSRAWLERIYQPLTHPYVLRRDWIQGEIWADEDEVRVQQEAVARLLLGLTRRCRRQVYLAFSELNERGYEQQGPVLQAVQHILRRQKREHP